MQCLIVTDTKDTGRQLIPRQHSVVRVKSSIDSIIYAYCSPRFFDLATPRGSDSQVLCVYSLYYSAMGRGAEYCDERVCLCVCLSSCPRAYLRKYTFYLQFFMHVVPYLWPYLGPVVAALRYVMYFRFYR